MDSNHGDGSNNLLVAGRVRSETGVEDGASCPVHSGEERAHQEGFSRRREPRLAKLMSSDWQPQPSVWRTMESTGGRHDGVAGAATAAACVETSVASGIRKSPP